jgi:hypothetical protein
MFWRRLIRRQWPWSYFFGWASPEMTGRVFESLHLTMSLQQVGQWEHQPDTCLPHPACSTQTLCTASWRAMAHAGCGFTRGSPRLHCGGAACLATMNAAPVVTHFQHHHGTFGNGGKPPLSLTHGRTITLAIASCAMRRVCWAASHRFQPRRASRPARIREYPVCSMSAEPDNAVCPARPARCHWRCRAHRPLTSGRPEFRDRHCDGVLLRF